jgi:hypothetical protein
MLFCIDLNILGGVGEAGARDPKARPKIGFFPFIMVSKIYIELVYFSIHPTFFRLIKRTIQNIVNLSYIKMNFHDYQFFYYKQKLHVIAIFYLSYSLHPMKFVLTLSKFRCI